MLEVLLGSRNCEWVFYTSEEIERLDKQRKRPRRMGKPL